MPQPQVHLTPAQQQLLRDRYGPARRHSRAARIGVGVAVVAFLAWVVWAAFGQSEQAVRWRTNGYSDVTETGVVVSFEVYKQPGATVVCDVRALDVSGAVVGETQVPVSGPDTQVTVSYPLKVIRRPTSAEVVYCTAADPSS